MFKQSKVGNMTQERDFSNPAEALEVLEQLGGELLLKEQFPKVYKAYLDTIVKHEHQKRLSQSQDLSQMTARLTNGVFAMPISLTPYEFNISQSQVSGEGSNDQPVKGFITSKISVQGTEDWLSAFLRGSIKNETDGCFIHNFDQNLMNTNNCDIVHNIDSDDLNQLSQKVISNCIDCTAVTHDHTLLCLYAKSSESILNGSSSPVASISIEDPRSKQGNRPISIMYGRIPRREEISDYCYPENRLISAIDGIKLIMPLKGKITFRDDFIPLGYNAELSNMKPVLKFKDKGVGTYNYDQSAIAACFKISEANSQIVEFQFNEDWQVTLDVSTLEAQSQEGDIGFEFSFYMTVNMRGTNITFDQAIAVYSTVTLAQSKQYYDSTNDASAYLPMIAMQWGCFGKDTMIRMGDGSEKKVSDILTGDCIQGIEGNRLKVSNLITGDEETIFCIRTTNRRLLEVTAGHPLKTSEGTCRAREVRTSTRLICEDGSEDVVELCYQNEYHDKVYGIVTEGGGNWLIANGLVAGDLSKQNELVKTVSVGNVLSEDSLALKAEFRRLMDYLTSNRSAR